MLNKTLYSACSALLAFSVLASGCKHAGGGSQGTVQPPSPSAQQPNQEQTVQPENLTVDTVAEARVFALPGGDPQPQPLSAKDPKQRAVIAKALEWLHAAKHAADPSNGQPADLRNNAQLILTLADGKQVVIEPVREAKGLFAYFPAVGGGTPVYYESAPLADWLSGGWRQDVPAAAALPDASVEWPYYGNNLWQTRFSPDDTLTPDTVAKLKLVYDKQLPESAGGNEAYPIMENGILYVTTGQAHVLALDAASGNIIWTYKPTIHAVKGIPQINRGVAIGADKVYVLTPDNQLIALRKADGSAVFRTIVADRSFGYFESMAPLYADGKVFVGSSGGDLGVRGFMAAYDAETGKQLWQFYTVPERGKDWLPAEGEHGGGAVWTTPSYDPATKRLYLGTGNPSPDYFGEERKGPNPYTDSVVALNADTGKLVWVQQEVAHDLWDYDVASPPLLFPLGSRTVVGEAGKDGFWYEWDAATGTPLIEPAAFVKQDRKPPTAEGTKVWPGPAGGANYGPSAYNPLTKSVYVSGINGPEILYSKRTEHEGHGIDLGTGQNPAPAEEWSGTITSIAAETGTVQWQITTATPAIGGVTANAGGLVFFGQSNALGTFEAVDAATGVRLWKTDTKAPIGSAPILYQWKGSTYVTVVNGGAKSLTSLYPYSGPAHVLTYRLEP